MFICGLHARFSLSLLSMEGWDWRLLEVGLGRKLRMALLLRLFGWAGWGDYVLLARWEEVVISGRGWGGNVALGDVPKSCNTLWVFTLKSGSLWQLSRLIEWISMYKLHVQSIFNTKATFNNICFLLLVATTTTAATGNHNLGTQFFHEDSLDCT